MRDLTIDEPAVNIKAASVRRKKPMKPDVQPIAFNPKMRQAVNEWVATQTLKEARQFAFAHTGGVLLQRRVKLANGRWVIIRLEWPCRMSVFDEKTGETIALSKLNSPGLLDPSFKAPNPDPKYPTPDPLGDEVWRFRS
jgi:hypothetical protein